MDFVPETSTGVGAGGGYYERYVSESESTDGEGDASGGGVIAGGKSKSLNFNHRNTQRRQHPTARSFAPEGYADFASGDEGVAPSVDELRSASLSASSSSFFAKIAASWNMAGARGSSSQASSSGKFSSKKRGETTAVWAKDSGGKRASRDPGAKYSVGGGPLEGNMDGNGGTGVVTQALRNGYSEAAKGISMGSSASGLKGLKSSLLADDDGPMPGIANGGDGAAGGNASASENAFSRNGVPRSHGLWDEASKGEVDSISAALEPGGGGDVNACQVDGWTALHTAADAGHSTVVTLLLRKGASPHAQARHGWTPLHAACMRGRSQAAKALLAGGAGPNVRSFDQRTALHFACEAGSQECVKELLLAGAAANVSDQDARTPLHFACIDGSTDCVRRLLRAGASTVPPDAWGRDPAAVARQLGRAGPLKLLEAAARGGGGGTASGRASPPPTLTRSPSVGNGDGDSGGKDEGEEGSRTHVTGDRWVVMNEDGRMLERASGRVALFRSMASAADWANGLEIKSGSFQVAEVAPNMRKAFEKEIKFQVTGGGTASEEEEEEEQDPQWTRYRRQRAAAARGGGAAAAGRKKRGSWAATVQRDEENERAVLAAAQERLRDVTLERDAYRDKAASLEKALEAVLKDCEIEEAAAAAATSPSSTEGVPSSGCDNASDDRLTALLAADAAEGNLVAGTDGKIVVGVEGENEQEAKGEGLLSVEDLESFVSSGGDNADFCGDGNGDDVADDGGDSDDVGNGSVIGDLLESETSTEVNEERNEEAGAGGVEDDRDCNSENGGDKPLMSFDGDVPKKDEQNSDEGDQALLTFEESPEKDEIRSCTGTVDVTAEGSLPKGVAEGDVAVALTESNGNRGGAGEGEGGSEVDSGDDEAAQARLGTWLSGLKIRRSDAARYAESLVADGFDSGEALRGVREEELMQYGMKKGHARLIVRTLSGGVSL